MKGEIFMIFVQYILYDDGNKSKEINKMMGEQRIMHLLMSTKITDVIIDNTLYNVETFPITFMKREKY